MTEIKAYILYIIIIVSVISCRPTKYVGENEYLLDKVIIKPDNKDVSVTQLEEYLRQTRSRLS